MYTLTLYIAEYFAYAEDYEKIPKSIYRFMNGLDVALVVGIALIIIKG